MIERFTREDRMMFAFAEQEARDLGHPALGNDHLVLGMLCNARGPCSGCSAGGLALPGARAVVSAHRAAHPAADADRDAAAARATRTGTHCAPSVSTSTRCVRRCVEVRRRPVRGLGRTPRWPRRQAPGPWPQGPRPTRTGFRSGCGPEGPERSRGLRSGWSGPGAHGPGGHGTGRFRTRRIRTRRAGPRGFGDLRTRRSRSLGGRPGTPRTTRPRRPSAFRRRRPRRTASGGRHRPGPRRPLDHRAAPAARHYRRRRRRLPRGAGDGDGHRRGTAPGGRRLDAPVGADA